MFYKAKSYKGRGKTRMNWPGSFHKARAPDILYSNAYCRFSANEPLFNTWDASGTFDDTTLYEPQPCYLPAGRSFQRTDSDTSTLFHAVQMNDPYRPLVGSPSYIAPPAAAVNARLGTFDSGSAYPQHAMNLRQWAKVYTYCAPYKCKIWVDFLPACVTSGTALTDDDLNVDSLRIYYALRNLTAGDVTYTANPGISQAAQAMNPYEWTQAINPSNIQATSEIKSIPLSSPNTVGGMTRISATWSLRNQKERNVNYMLKNVMVSSGEGEDAVWQAPRDLSVLESNSPMFFFIFGLGTDIGKAAANYNVRYKVQLKWYYKCWEVRSDIKPIVQLVAAPQLPPAQVETQDEMETDEQSQGTYPSVPSTPVIEQLTRELASFGHAQKVLSKKKT